jgi:hypothetical protein
MPGIFVFVKYVFVVTDLPYTAFQDTVTKCVILRGCENGGI